MSQAVLTSTIGPIVRKYSAAIDGSFRAKHIDSTLNDSKGHGNNIIKLQPKYCGMTDTYNKMVNRSFSGFVMPTGRI
ncbi:MAG: hypothetical protein ABJZ69_06285 [Hyphomicrobiales bacterium]